LWACNNAKANIKKSGITRRLIMNGKYSKYEIKRDFGTFFP
jgi:hypothetical protein